ncbi:MULTISPECIES: hypothetical protein [Clostridium]|uniref:Polysaccharide deacetylase n=1 Tax=Clostridium diolis TaxID=223919 RepID=A0AAV3VY90_9CLOT|nr:MULTISPECIES: hypothetical protein [Clostridium]ALB44178.1 hypothetical protein X276_02280 [Clostridium beijerinckii NRRL B-598]GEA30473.1 hypothetical protein CDIOL_13960 [Clostridium diolis]
MDFFSYSNYKIILNKMKAIKEIYNFKSINNSIKNGYILRHDVDIDIEKAYALSTIENDMNVTSTYFILVTSDLYNILSYKNKMLVRRMFLNGFEIGLHFDPSIYDYMSLSQLEKQMKKECSIIEDIIGEKVSSISLHNPSIHNKYPIFKEYKNTYSKEFFNPELYLSDSCKDFRGKNVFEFIKKGENNLLQVLFHPIHFSENEETYVESFNKIIELKINNFDRYYTCINKTYKNEIKENTLLSCFKDYIKENNKHEEKI